MTLKSTKTIPRPCGSPCTYDHPYPTSIGNFILQDFLENLFQFEHCPEVLERISHWHRKQQWRNDDDESAPQTVATPNSTQTTPPSSSAKRTAAQSMPVISPAEAGPGRRLDATAVRQSTPDPEQVIHDSFLSPLKNIFGNHKDGKVGPH